MNQSKDEAYAEIVFKNYLTAAENEQKAYEAWMNAKADADVAYDAYIKSQKYTREIPKTEWPF